MPGEDGVLPRNLKSDKHFKDRFFINFENYGPFLAVYSYRFFVLPLFSF